MDDFAILPREWLQRCVAADMDTSAALALHDREDHSKVSVSWQWPVDRANWQTSALSYNRNALRLWQVKDARLAGCRTHHEWLVHWADVQALREVSARMLQRQAPQPKLAPRKSWVTGAACSAIRAQVGRRSVSSGLATSMCDSACEDFLVGWARAVGCNAGNAVYRSWKP